MMLAFPNLLLFPSESEYVGFSGWHGQKMLVKRYLV